MAMKIENLIKSSRIMPVLTNQNINIELTVSIDAGIDSKSLGIVNTSNGLRTPQWFEEINNLKEPILVIKNIDSIPIDLQEKFYEILHYKTISSVALPANISIIVTYKDIENVSKSIKSLCMLDL